VAILTRANKLYHGHLLCSSILGGLCLGNVISTGGARIDSFEEWGKHYNSIERTEEGMMIVQNMLIVVTSFLDCVQELRDFGQLQSSFN
jgi:hypothetical protein